MNERQYTNYKGLAVLIVPMIIFFVLGSSQIDEDKLIFYGAGFAILGILTYTVIKGNFKASITFKKSKKY